MKVGIWVKALHHSDNVDNHRVALQAFDYNYILIQYFVPVSFCHIEVIIHTKEKQPHVLGLNSAILLTK